MNVFKFFFNITNLLSAPQAVSPVMPDPGDHPEIRSMDMRQLADLPWPRRPELEAEQEAPHPMQRLSRCA